MFGLWIARYFCVLVSLLTPIDTLFAATDQQSPSPTKGLTVDDLTRGVKRAVQNIEQEIPKIGPALGKTLKTITGKGSNKPPAQDSTSSGKK